MDVLVERCAGLDVHKDTVVACVLAPGVDATPVTFGTTSAALLALRDWLVACGVTRVGMEATGVYWKPVYYVLEDALEAHLYNARHMRNVPGRKTDVADAAWIAQLTRFGLVRPSFVPEPAIRDLRALTRYRRAQIEERGREAQRLDKVLQDAGIRLSSVASDVLGASGRAMLQALVEGTRDPEVLAELARGRLRAKLPQLEAALAGRFGEVHTLLVASILSKLDFLDEQIGQLTERIGRVIDPFVDKAALLESIPGVGRRTAEAILAEIGPDMGVFPTAPALASFAGVCPGNHQSAGRNKSGRTRHGSKWLDAALHEAAMAASRTKGTYLSAQYARLRPRRGHAKAIRALQHSILTAIWHMLTHDIPYQDLGSDYFQRRNNPEHQARKLIGQLKKLGYTVTLDQTPQPI